MDCKFLNDILRGKIGTDAVALVGWEYRKRYVYGKR